MEVSLIIPTCNRPKMLAECVERLRVQTVQHKDCEIVIGNDGVSLEKMPGVRIVPGPGRGPGANRNAAAAQARGRFLIFVDDDCVPQEGFLAAYLGAFGNEETVVYFGMTQPGPNDPNSLMWEAPHNLNGTVPPPSCNFAMCRALFEAAGGFDERYLLAFEDMEFFSRLETMGASFRFVPEAKVVHPWRELPSARALAARWEARVISTLDYGAHPLEVVWLLPRHVLLVIASRFRDRPKAKDRWRAARRFAAEFLWLSWRLPGWVARHRRSPRSHFWVKHAPPPKYGL